MTQTVDSITQHLHHYSHQRMMIITKEEKYNNKNNK